MKRYTVKEISELLKTNPETVRRWIRAGKLEAERTSKKEGNYVTEQSLNKFLQSAPKYAGIAAGTVGILGLSVLVPGMSTFTTPILSTFLSQSFLNKNKQTEVTKQEIETLLRKSIKSTEDNIFQKKEELRIILKEIEAEKAKIEEMERILTELNKVDENKEGE